MTDAIRYLITDESEGSSARQSLSHNLLGAVAVVQVDVDDGDLAQACREAEQRVACRDRRVVEQAEPLGAVHPVAGSWVRHEAKGTASGSIAHARRPGR